jgi:HAD superfamily hydrolase (TIGR01509 family)
MIEAVVFDMDGLLVDSEPLWQRAREAALGADRLRWTEADQLRIMGSSTLAWAQFLAERVDFEFTTDEIIDRVLTEMENLYHHDLPLMPGAASVLASLNGHYPLGLASGAPYRLIRAVLHSAGWNHLFRDVLSSDDLNAGKPAPEIYLEIARRLDTPAEQIAIFEDSGNGILAGYAAGVKVIAVPGVHHRPAADALAKADLVLSSLTEFSPAMLETL